MKNRDPLKSGMLRGGAATAMAVMMSFVAAAPARAAVTVEAATSCTFAQTNSGIGVRQGVTFTVPAGADALDAFNMAVLNTGPVATANEFTAQLLEWDAAAGEAVGPILYESSPVAASGFGPADAWLTLVSMGQVTVIPNATYVVTVPSEGSAAEPLALCLASTPLTGSSMVVSNPATGWSAPPVAVPPGFSAVFLTRPHITAVTPQAFPGDTITITGSGFDSALTTGVTIAGLAASFTVVSPTELTAQIPLATPVGPADVQVTSDTLLSAITAASRLQILAATPALPPVVPPVTPPAVSPPVTTPPVVAPPANTPGTPVVPAPQPISVSAASGDSVASGTTATPADDERRSRLQDTGVAAGSLTIAGLGVAAATVGAVIIGLRRARDIRLRMPIRGQAR